MQDIGIRTVQLAFLALVLMCAACGGSPTSPSGSGANFQGVWNGTWQRTSCSDTVQGQACAATTLPSSGALRLTLTQAGTEVQGTVEINTLLIGSSGLVSANGTLTLAGSAHLGGDTPGTFNLPTWSTSRSGTTMSGSFTLRFVADNPALGSQTLQLTLQNVNKTS